MHKTFKELYLEHECLRVEQERLKRRQQRTLPKPMIHPGLSRKNLPDYIGLAKAVLASDLAVNTPELAGLVAEIETFRQALGDEFARILKDWLTPAEFTEMKILNNADPRARSGQICHSHDFCDANMAMLEAYCNLTNTHQDDFCLNCCLDDFNAAWLLAKAAHIGGAEQ